MRHGAGDHHQLHGLGNGHKVADDALVRQRDGATGLDLPLKQRDHRAVAAQHVAEAHRRELRLAALPTLDHHFAQALAGTHNIGGVHGLVRGNQQEFFHAVLLRHFRHVVCTQHVVFQRLHAGMLHQRHMLVRSGVEHDVRPQVAENVIQALHIPNGGDDDLQVQLFAIFADQLLLHIVGIVFVNIQNGQLFRVQGCDLPAQLRADRPAAAGDQHGLPLVKRSGLGILHLDGVAEQQILDAEVPQLALLGGRVVLRSGGVVV